MVLAFHLQHHILFKGTRSGAGQADADLVAAGQRSTQIAEDSLIHQAAAGCFQFRSQSLGPLGPLVLLPGQQRHRQTQHHQQRRQGHPGLSNAASPIKSVAPARQQQQAAAQGQRQQSHPGQLLFKGDRRNQPRQRHRPCQCRGTKQQHRHTQCHRQQQRKVCGRPQDVPN